MSKIGKKISEIRGRVGLTVQRLAEAAHVPATLISGLQNGYRVIGEDNARKIGRALHLSGIELERFVYLAINDCAEKVLAAHQGYPAEVLNLVAGKLASLGVMPEEIASCVYSPRLGNGTSDAAIYLNDGRVAVVDVNLTYR